MKTWRDIFKKIVFLETDLLVNIKILSIFPYQTFMGKTDQLWSYLNAG